MNGFKTYIITKKTLIKFGIIFSMVILAIIFFIVLITKQKNTDTIAVFSYNAENILERGVVSDNDSLTAKKVVNKILGFDSEDPISIIESSGAEFATPSPAPVSVTQTPLPQNTKKPIIQTQTISDLKINNATNYEIDLNTLIKQPLDIKLKLKEPEVLIVHTHTTECYNGNEMTGESERTTNEKYNMCRIGSIVAETLNSYGIKTIHDKTIHDYPSYQGAYTRALKTIEKNIKEHPSIKVVLDIHRDAYVYADGSKLRVSTKIDGEDVAQVMLVLGTDSMGLEHSNWKSNLTLASKIQNTAQELYPNMMRPLNLRRERFNMHMTKGSLLLEIGSNGNSMAEAEKAAVNIANAIADVLLNE